MQDKHKRLAWISAAIGSVGVLIFNPEAANSMAQHLSDVSQNQFSKNLFIFSLAAVIHSNRMKKEIRSNFDSLIASIDNVSATLRADLGEHGKVLQTHGQLLDKHSGMLDGLTVKVDAQASAMGKLKTEV